MAVNISVWQISETTYRIRCCATDERAKYRFVRGSRAEADAAAAAWLADAKMHGPAPVSPATTLSAWIVQCMATASLQPRTRDFYNHILTEHFGSLGARKLNSLTAGDGISFQLRLHEKFNPGRYPEGEAGKTTIRHCFRLAKWALGEAVKMRVLPANPFAHVRRMAPIAPDVKLPSGQQLAAVAQAAKGRTGLLLRLAINTGARRNEILALTWNHVDLAAGKIQIAGALEQRNREIRVKAPKTKTGRRSITIPPALVAELRGLRVAAAESALAAGKPIGDVPVLPGTDSGFWSPMAATKAAKRALAAASLPGTLHGLRHAHATALLGARMNPRAVQARLGHAHIQTTLAIYGHTMPGDDEAAAAAIAAALGEKSA